jgi:hypothetical protein
MKKEKQGLVFRRKKTTINNKISVPEGYCTVVKKKLINTGG